MANKTLILFAVSIWLWSASPAHAAGQVFTLSNRLAGQILLQTEQRGEAWYVHPDTLLRYYLPDGTAAYDMMRYFGLGISEDDYAKVEKRDKNLLNTLKGKIILRVHKNGEAYYIKPQDLSVHYLQNGEKAYELMREHSLGITDDDLEDILIGRLTRRTETLLPGTCETVNTQLSQNNYWKGFNIWTETKNFLEAEKYYAESLRLDPDYAPALSSYGFIRAAFYDEYETGEKFLNRAMQIDPEWAYAPFNLGIMYDLEQLYFGLSNPPAKNEEWLKKRQAYAVKWLEFTVNRFPEHPDIYHFKKQLSEMEDYYREQ